MNALSLLQLHVLLVGSISAAPVSPTPTPPVVVVVPAPSVSVTAPVTVTVPRQEDWPLIVTTGAVALSGLIAAAAAIAIALDWPRQALKAPSLVVSIEDGPPDRHLIKTFVGATETADDMIIEERTAYYCRVRVANSPPGRVGRLEARDVEVQLISLYAIREKVEELDPVFLPIRLLWSHVHGPVRDRIMPGLYSHADLLRIINDDDGEPWLEFLTEVSPNPFPGGEIPNVKAAGHYRLDFAAAAANASTEFYRADIRWSGVFDPHDAERMKSELTIVLIPGTAAVTRQATGPSPSPPLDASPA